ncbi:MAG: hypothetical protein CMG46_00180 [Candidatus Marinimicrobia bacterium]|nr:hypothetical protein [Candidatus Neomarinimicrobiota bacterium]
MEKWLNSYIPYSTSIIKDVINISFNILYIHLRKYPWIDSKYDIDKLRYNFYTFIHNEYIIKKPSNIDKYTEEFEYLDLKLSEECINLYIKFRDLFSSYGLSIFNGYNSNSYPLLVYIYNNYIINIYDNDDTDINDPSTDYYDILYEN